MMASWLQMGRRIFGTIDPAAAALRHRFRAILDSTARDQSLRVLAFLPGGIAMILLDHVS